MKKCPYCAEEIQEEAIKCKHCGEWVSEIDRELIKEHEESRRSLEGLQTIAECLIDARLTAAEYRLYLYLLTLDLEGRGNAELLNPSAIMERLDISRDTFFVAIARLRELGLYDFKARRSKEKRI